MAKNDILAKLQALKSNATSASPLITGMPKPEAADYFGNMMNGNVPFTFPKVTEWPTDNERDQINAGIDDIRSKVVTGPRKASDLGDVTEAGDLSFGPKRKGDGAGLIDKLPSSDAGRPVFGQKPTANMGLAIDQTLREAEELAGSTTDKHSGNSGIVSGFDLVDTATGGLSESARKSSQSIATKNIEKKVKAGIPLSKEEQLFVDAIGLRSKADALVTGEGGQSTGYQVGKVVGQMPEFVAQIVGTAPVGGEVGTALKGVSWIANGIKAGAPLWRKGLTLAGIELGKASVVTPLQPMFASAFADQELKQYSITRDESGDVIAERSNPQSVGTSLAKAFAQTLTENWSEGMGEVFGKAGAKMVQGIAKSKLGVRMAGSQLGSTIAKANDLIQKTTGRIGATADDFGLGGVRAFTKDVMKWHGTLNEIAEEEFNMVVQPLLMGEPEQLKSIVDVEQQLVTALSCAVAGVGFKAVEIPGYVQSGIAINQNKKAYQQNITNLRPEIASQVVAAFGEQDIEARGSALASLPWAQMQPAEREQVVNAVWHRTRYDFLRGAKAASDAEQALNDIHGRTENVLFRGSESHPVEGGSLYIATLPNGVGAILLDGDIVSTTDADGNAVHYTAPNGRKPVVVTEDGRRLMVDHSELNGLTMVPRSEFVSQGIDAWMQQQDAQEEQQDAQDADEDMQAASAQPMLPAPEANPIPDELPPPPADLVNDGNGTVTSYQPDRPQNAEPQVRYTPKRGDTVQTPSGVVGRVVQTSPDGSVVSYLDENGEEQIEVTGPQDVLQPYIEEQSQEEATQQSLAQEEQVANGQPAEPQGEAKPEVDEPVAATDVNDTAEPSNSNLQPIAVVGDSNPTDNNGVTNVGDQLTEVGNSGSLQDAAVSKTETVDELTSARGQENGSQPRTFQELAKEILSTVNDEPSMEAPHYVSRNRNTLYTIKDGELLIMDRSGVEVPRTVNGKANPTYTRLANEYKKVFDYSKGEQGVAEGYTNEDEAASMVISTSNNPLELAQIHLSETAYGNDLVKEAEVSVTGVILEVAQSLKVSKAGFEEHADPNFTTGTIAMTYFSKDGRNPSDIAAMVNAQLRGEWDATSELVTADDVVQAMLSYPRGMQDFSRQIKNGTHAKEAAEAFSALTGFDITPSVVEKVKILLQDTTPRTATAEELEQQMADDEWAHRVEVAERMGIDMAAEKDGAFLAPMLQQTEESNVQQELNKPSQNDVQATGQAEGDVTGSSAASRNGDQEADVRTPDQEHGEDAGSNTREGEGTNTGNAGEGSKNEPKRSNADTNPRGAEVALTPTQQAEYDRRKGDLEREISDLAQKLTAARKAKDKAISDAQLRNGMFGDTAADPQQATIDGGAALDVRSGMNTITQQHNETIAQLSKAIEAKKKELAGLYDAVKGQAELFGEQPTLSNDEKWLLALKKNLKEKEEKNKGLLQRAEAGENINVGYITSNLNELRAAIAKLEEKIAASKQYTQEQLDVQNHTTNTPEASVEERQEELGVQKHTAKDESQPIVTENTNENPESPAIGSDDAVRNEQEAAFRAKLPFYTQALDNIRRLYHGELTLEQYKQAFKELQDSKETIISELGGNTKDVLLALMGPYERYQYKNEKKDRIVKVLYQNLLIEYAFNSISYDFSTPTDVAIARKVENTTQNDLTAFVEDVKRQYEERQKEKDAKQKALDNPETLDEFRIFISKNGIEALSDEQLEAFDKLITQAALKQKSERKSDPVKAEPVAVSTEGLTLHETKHTKTGEPLFVVQLPERVSKEEYQTYNSRAKSLGGYYSSYRGNGAIPGFTFKSIEQAEAFMGSAESRTEKEEAQEPAAPTAQKLRELGEKVVEAANEALNRDRLTNTVKRAREAEYADSNARKLMRIGQTMINIANAVDAGDDILVGNIKAKTHVELLESILASAKWRMYNDKEKSSSYKDREAYLNADPTEAVLRYVQNEYLPRIYKDNMLRMVRAALNVKGMKQQAARWEKGLSAFSGEYFTPKNEQQVEELTQMMNALPEKERVSVIEDQLANHRRLKAMGIENESMLRELLREYLKLRATAVKEDEVKRLERELVGSNVGFDFFPTPKVVVDRMVDEADIREGMDVLEPSAGNGNIADGVRETGVEPDVVELSSALAKVLEAKGFNVVGDDFMGFNEKKYDRIVMNPPFSNGMDGEHIRHAYDLLKPGGRIVAIAGEGIFFRSDRKSTEFRDWLESVGGYSEKLPEGTFTDKKLLNTTGANSRMVVIDKPEEGPAFSKTQPLPETITVDGVERPTTNSEGKPIHATADGVVNFWRWFGDSKVVDEQGRPMVVYHGTDKEVEIFNRLSHFGTYKAASDRLDYTERNGNIYPFYIKIESPLTIKDDGLVNSLDIAFQLSRYISFEFDSIISEWTDTLSEEEISDVSMYLFDGLYGKEGIEERLVEYINNNQYTDCLNAMYAGDYRELEHPKGNFNVIDDIVSDELENNDIDGLVYKNKYEDKTSVSWITTNSNQIKSATDNSGTFSHSDDRIIYSRSVVAKAGEAVREASVAANDAAQRLSEAVASVEAQHTNPVEHIDGTVAQKVESATAELREEAAKAEEAKQEALGVLVQARRIDSDLPQLVDELQTISAPSGGWTVESAQAFLDEMKAKYPTAGEAIAVADANEAADAMLKMGYSKKLSERVRGEKWDGVTLPDGRVILRVDNPSLHIAATWAHEQGHSLMSRMLDSRDRMAIGEAVCNAIGVREILDYIGQEYASEPIWLIGEEYLMHRVADIVSGQPITAAPASVSELLSARHGANAERVEQIISTLVAQILKKDGNKESEWNGNDFDAGRGNNDALQQDGNAGAVRSVREAHSGRNVAAGIVEVNRQGERNQERVAAAEEQTNTNPSEAQKDAGNYRKGKARVLGMEISIENPQGSTRSGVDPNGKAWSITMPQPYGYILGTVGKDKDHIDVYLGKNLTKDTPVFIVNQVDPSTGKLDEHKVMLGYPTYGAAKRAYMSAYEDGWKGFGSMGQMSLDEFKEWAYNSNTKAAVKAVEPTAELHDSQEFHNAWHDDDILGLPTDFESALAFARRRGDVRTPDKQMDTLNGSKVSELRENAQDATLRVRKLQGKIESEGGRVPFAANAWEALNRYTSAVKAKMDYFEQQELTALIEKAGELCKRIDASWDELGDYLLAKHGIGRQEVGGVSAFSDEAGAEWTLDNAKRIVEEFEKKATPEDIVELWEAVRSATTASLKALVDGGMISQKDADAYMSRPGWEHYVPLRDFDVNDELKADDVFEYSESRNPGKGTFVKATQTAKGRTSKPGNPIPQIAAMFASSVSLAEKNRAKQALLNLVRLNPNRSEYTATKSWFVLDGATNTSLEVFEKPQQSLIELQNACLQFFTEPDIQVKNAMAQRIKDLRDAAINDGADANLVGLVMRQGMKDGIATISAKQHKSSILGETKEQDRQHMVAVFEDGVKYVIWMQDAELAAAVNHTNINSKFNETWIGRVMGGMNRWLSVNFTGKNPAFIPINWARDVQYATISHLIRHDGEAARMAANMGKAATAIHRYMAEKANPLTESELAGYSLHNPADVTHLIKTYGKSRVTDTLYQQYRNNGGETGYIHTDDIRTWTKRLRRHLEREMGTNPTLDKLKQAGSKYTGLRAAGHLLDYAAYQSENMTRFATFLASWEQGKGFAESATDAKNITVNFNRKGRNSGVLNSLLVFFNATVQGTDNLLDRIVLPNKGRFAVAASLLFAASLTAATMALSAYGDDEDNPYWRMPEYVRYNSILIPTYGIGGKEKYIIIPLPPGLRFINGWSVAAMEGYYGRKTPMEVGAAMASSVIDNTSPIGVKGGDLTRSIIPSVGVPIYDMATNKDYAGRTVYREMFTPELRDNTPNSQQGSRNVNEAFAWFAEKLNALGGGSATVPAGVDPKTGKSNPVKRFIFDWNPSKLEHLLTYFAGGRGQFFMDCYRTARPAWDKEQELEARNIPIVRRLYGGTSEASDAKAFYERVDNLNRYEFYLNNAFKNNDPEAVKLSLTYPEVYRWAAMGKVYQEQIQDLAKTADAKGVTLEQRKRLLEQRKVMMRQFLDQTEKYEQPEDKLAKQ